MKTYTINKNKHYSRIPFPIPHCKVKEYEALAIFNANCWYPLDTTQPSGLNKLCGFTYGGVHKTSFRIAWQPDFTSPNRIKLYAYSYINGVRNMHHITNVNTDYAFDIVIIYENNSVTYIIDSIKYVIPVYSKPKLGVYCFPYFGGEAKAPNTMKIELEYQHFKP